MNNDKTQSVLSEVLTERLRQHAKFGEQNHPNGTRLFALADLSFNGTTANKARCVCDAAFANKSGTWAHILYEEVAEALEEKNSPELRAELIQVAAVAVAWIEALDRKAQR